MFLTEYVSLVVCKSYKILMVIWITAWIQEDLKGMLMIKLQSNTGGVGA